MKLFANILNQIIFLRASVFQEAYLAETKSGGNSKAIAACLVGIFDAPLILAILLFLDSVICNDICIRPFFSSNITSTFSLVFVSVVCIFEYFYYQVFRVGLTKIVSVPNHRTKIAGLTYGALSMVGGGLLVYFIW